jgi:hypothetical protein
MKTPVLGATYLPHDTLWIELLHDLVNNSIFRVELKVAQSHKAIKWRHWGSKPCF